MLRTSAAARRSLKTVSDAASKSKRKPQHFAEHMPEEKVVLTEAAQEWAAAKPASQHDKSKRQGAKVVFDVTTPLTGEHLDSMLDAYIRTACVRVL
jgi:hypothetical protein